MGAVVVKLLDMVRHFSLDMSSYKRIGAPDQVIDWLRTGVPIPFKQAPNKCFYANRVKSLREESFIDEEIAKLVKEGSIKESESKPTCVLAIQTVPKKNGNLCLVVDSRPVNTYINTPTFTQDYHSGRIN